MSSRSVEENRQEPSQFAFPFQFFLALNSKEVFGVVEYPGEWRHALLLKAHLPFRECQKLAGLVVFLSEFQIY